MTNHVLSILRRQFDDNPQEDYRYCVSENIITCYTARSIGEIMRLKVYFDRKKGEFIFTRIKIPEEYFQIDDGKRIMTLWEL